MMLPQSWSVLEPTTEADVIFLVPIINHMDMQGAPDWARYTVGSLLLGMAAILICGSAYLLWRDR
jgi:hypothetical protein